MQLDFISVAGIAFISGLSTLALVAETEPIINEDGEEEYSTKGYILLTVAYVIRGGFNLIKHVINWKGKEIEVVEEEIPEVKIKPSNEFEIFI